MSSDGSVSLYPFVALCYWLCLRKKRHLRSGGVGDSAHCGHSLLAYSILIGLWLDEFVQVDWIEGVSVCSLMHLVSSSFDILTNQTDLTQSESNKRRRLE